MIVITCIFQNIGFDIANTACLKRSYLQLPQTLLFMHRLLITCIFQNIGFNIANTLCLQKSYLQLPQTLLFMHRF